MMSLAKLFAPSATSQGKTTSDGKSWPMFPLDAQIHTEPLRVCKSLIPYLPLEKQKNISIFIKVFELMAVINYYSDMDDLDFQHTNFRESETWQKDLLYSVKDSLDPSNAYWVDILLKIGDVKQILADAQSVPPSRETQPKPTSNDSEKSKEFIQNISPMLDDNQKKILEMLSTIM